MNKCQQFDSIEMQIHFRLNSINYNHRNGSSIDRIEVSLGKRVIDMQYETMTCAISEFFSIPMSIFLF